MDVESESLEDLADKESESESCKRGKDVCCGFHIGFISGGTGLASYTLYELVANNIAVFADSSEPWQYVVNGLALVFGLGASFTLGAGTGGGIGAGIGYLKSKYQEYFGCRNKLY